MPFPQNTATLIQFLRPGADLRGLAYIIQDELQNLKKNTPKSNKGDINVKIR